MDSTFAEAVEREFAFLIEGHGFQFAGATEEVVRFTSSHVEVRLSYYSSEWQVDLAAFPIGADDPHTRFQWNGMVGRASVERLVQLAAAAMRANAPAVSGDESYYRELGAAQRREAEAWTAYYAGRGPRPTGRRP